MSRALLFPLTMMLLIATAIAMLASAMILPMSEAPALSGPARTDVVERFYAAVNEAIATGDPAALRSVVNPSYADENPLPGVSPGRDGLEAYLATLHDADPGLRLEPRVLFASAQEVVAEVAVAHGPAVAVPPAFGAQQAVWSPLEVLRVADGVVVGRWGHTDGLVLARPLAAEALDLQVPTPHVIGLARVTQAPGTRWDAPRVTGPRLLLLQQGVVEAQAVLDPTVTASPGTMTSVDASNAGRVRPPIRTTLGAGQTWLAPAGALTSTVNTGSSESHLLVVSFTGPQIPDFAAPPARPLATGVTMQVLAGDLATGIASGPVRIALEQIALTPQASLTLASTEGPIMVAVETGQVEATAWGTAWLRRQRNGMSSSVRAAIALDPESGLLLQQRGVVTLRNQERAPAQALVLTVREVSADRDDGP